MHKKVRRIIIFVVTMLMVVLQFQFDYEMFNSNMVSAKQSKEFTERKSHQKLDLDDGFILKDGKGNGSLDGDWAYVSSFTIDSVVDGSAPFDTSDDIDSISYKNRKGNDENANNGIVRTFDTVTYNLSYTTELSGEQATIEKGYLYYEFVLPYAADQAQWEIEEMIWIGTKVNTLADLLAKNDGYNYYCIETKQVAGVMSQVMTGKRYLVAIPPNPTAFPGSGNLIAVMRVLNMHDGNIVAPKFKVWLNHNHLEGVCPIHNRIEPKSLDTAVDAAPVTVTCELRLNVQLRDVPEYYTNGVLDYDFSIGNDLAMNKTAGIVNGRIVGYGITLQLYNLDPADGLKGVAVPIGPISFDVDLISEYQKKDGTIISNLPAIYTPLVWSYEANIACGHVYAPQKDGRPINSVSQSCCALGAAPHHGYAINHPPMGTYSPKTGAGNVWNGGTWSGVQNGRKVSFVIQDYIVNPNWFPNPNAGNNASTYFNPAEGVRSSNIGCFSAGELFVIVPFGNNDDYLEDVYGEGRVILTIKDYNLQASTITNDGTIDSLPVVSDNSNQTVPNRPTLPPEDDILTRNVNLRMPGYYQNHVVFHQGGGIVRTRAIIGENVRLDWGIFYN